MRDSRLHSHQSIGDGQFRVIVAVNTKYSVKTRPNLTDNLYQALGERTAIGVTQAKHVGPGAFRCFQSSERKGGVSVVTIEKMLGVVDDLSAVGAQVRHGFRNNAHVLFFGDAEGSL